MSGNGAGRIEDWLMAETLQKWVRQPERDKGQRAISSMVRSSVEREMIIHSDLRRFRNEAQRTIPLIEGCRHRHRRARQPVEVKPFPSSTDRVAPAGGLKSSARQSGRLQGRLDGGLVGFFDLVEDIADLVSPAALDRDLGIDRGQGGEEALVVFGYSTGVPPLPLLTQTLIHHRDLAMGVYRNRLKYWHYWQRERMPVYRCAR